MPDISQFLNQVAQWASGHSDVLAVGLVGSHARGMARADLDVDLVVLLDDPRSYLERSDWMRRFGEVVEEPEIVALQRLPLAHALP